MDRLESFGLLVVSYHWVTDFDEIWYNLYLFMRIMKESKAIQFHPEPSFIVITLKFRSYDINEYKMFRIVVSIFIL